MPGFRIQGVSLADLSVQEFSALPEFGFGVSGSGFEA